MLGLREGQESIFSVSLTLELQSSQRSLSQVNRFGNKIIINNKKSGSQRHSPKLQEYIRASWGRMIEWRVRAWAVQKDTPVGEHADLCHLPNVGILSKWLNFSEWQFGFTSWRFILA